MSINYVELMQAPSVTTPTEMDTCKSHNAGKNVRDCKARNLLGKDEASFVGKRVSYARGIL